MVNPDQQIRAYLGNDVKIIDYFRSDFQTSQQEYIVTVNYKTMDFSPYDIFKVIELKKLSNGSDKFVAKIENIRDKNETTECLVSGVDNGDYVSILPKNSRFRYIGIKLDKFSHSFCTL